MYRLVGGDYLPSSYKCIDTTNPLGISPCFPGDFPRHPLQEALPLGLCGGLSGGAADAVVSGTVRVTLSDVTAQQLQVVTRRSNRWRFPDGWLMVTGT